MLCKNHKDALIEAAASGAEPGGELRTHLDACADCRGVFEREQALFSSIDAGLHVTANGEVPASFLRRVRAGLETGVASKRSWASNWLVLASAAAILAAFYIVRGIWRPVVQQNPPTNSVRANPSAQVAPLAQEQPKTSGLSADNISHPRPRIVSSRDSLKRGSQTVRSSTPEVLVPHDQEVLLAEYAVQWNLHKRAPPAAQDAEATNLAPLQVAQIQIAELGVKPLAEDKSQ